MEFTSIVLKGIDDAYAGVYRDRMVFISGASHIPPAPYLIQEQMEQMMTWYHSGATSLHPVERGAMLHANFVGIYPFIDGNGRTARLLLNLELMKDGFTFLQNILFLHFLFEVCNFNLIHFYFKTSV
ncbi:Fic family protein [Niallia oryzisoli]|uniref:Fic family protein n=1 Tax=Niallia oryzisoli TaxID=1737571 RepID=A0ABZ2CDC3_9BACI